MQRSCRICKAPDLPAGKSIKFVYKVDGINIEGFAANFRGNLVAYENTCRHLPIPLDYEDNQFFTPDGEHLICQTHGAVYHPLSGHCLAGPCAGARLNKLHAVEIEGEIWVNLPRHSESSST